MSHSFPEPAPPGTADTLAAPADDLEAGTPVTHSDEGVFDPAGHIRSATAARRFDLEWTISLFGTAVGAGILFLPIKMGVNGWVAMAIVTALIGPLVYLAHRGLSRFVLSSKKPGEDITIVAQDFFGTGVGRVIMVLYFLAIYPIVLIYGVSITNVVNSFIVNQLGGPELPRVLLSGVLIALMMLGLVLGEAIMLKVTGWLVYPLIALLILLSLYLIPSWDLALFRADQGSGGSILLAVWLMLPVLVFAFNHSPAISQFSLSMQRGHGVHAEKHASKVLLRNATILVVFTMLFAWSCSLALGPEHLANAREENLPVLSYLANVRGEAFLSYVGPVIAFCAIVSSFFGHYLGATEGLTGIIRSAAPGWFERTPRRTVNLVVTLFMFVTTWAAAVVNPSILGLIDTLSGPIIATILFLMPMIAIYTVPKLAPFRRQASNWFVIVFGIATIAAALWSIDWAGLL